MIHGEAISIEQELPLLEEASARNRTVELHTFEAGDQLMTARARVLGVEDQHIRLDMPLDAGKHIAFSPGCILDVYLALGDVLYTFRSQLVESGCPIRLNDGTIVEGIRVTRPSAIKPGQRRQDYRVSMASINPITAHIHSVSADDPSAAPCDAQRAHGWLANLSTGGCGLILEAPFGQEMTSGHPMFVGFRLPIEGPPFIFQAELCQVISVMNGRGTRLGLRFLCWPDQMRYGQAMRPIERFLADMQRAEARRARSRR